jgi:MFS family permease
VTPLQTASLSEPGPAVTLSPTAAAPVQRAALSERGIILTTSLGHAVCHMGELVFGGVILAVMAEFHLDPEQAAAVPMAGFLLMGVGALPVGLWVDAWGPTRVLFLYLLAVSAASLGVALAPNVPVLLASLTLLGLALSLYHPAGLALLSVGVRARGRALGINGVAGSVGIALGPALGLWAANSLGIWRLAYFIVAGLALGAALLFWIIVWRCPGPVLSRPLPTTPGRQAAQTPAGPSSGGRRGLVALGILLVVMMLAGLNYRSLMMALPTFLGGEGGAVSARKDVLVFVVLLAGGLGQYFGGWAADRFGARVVYPLAIVVLAPLSLLVLFLEGTAVVGLGAALLMVFIFTQQPMENSLLAECTTAGRRGLIYGTKLILTFGVGAMGAMVTGWIWKTTGSPSGVFFFVAGSAGLMTVLALTALAARRRRALAHATSP